MMKIYGFPRESSFVLSPSSAARARCLADDGKPVFYRLVVPPSIALHCSRMQTAVHSWTPSISSGTVPD